MHGNSSSCAFFAVKNRFMGDATQKKLLSVEFIPLGGKIGRTLIFCCFIVIETVKAANI